MAIVNLAYGNASHFQKVEIQYNDVTHTIVSGVLAGSIVPFLPRSANEIFHTQEGVGFIYNLRVQNTAPYAYVQTIETACGVAIDDISVANASTNQASNGAIAVTAQGNGVLTYRIDELGAAYQSVPAFNGLAPGTYHLRVKNRNTIGSTITNCYAVQEFTVGYNNVVCELEIGTIQTFKDNGLANDGQIHVLTVVDPIGLPLEYRLDAGAWQDSGVFTGLDAGTYNVQVRYKDFTGCSATREVVVSDLVSCDARITGIEVSPETAKFADDGVITIVATSTNEPIQYSINDGDTYHASNIFSGLDPGEYTVRIKDAEDCEDVLAVIVPRFKAPYVEFPIAQSLRFVEQSGPNITSTRQNFDNRLFSDMKMPGILSECYFNPFELNDLIPVHFRSNYTSHVLRVYNALNNTLMDEFTPLKKTEYMNHVETRTVYFADAGLSKVQVYFDTEMPTYFEVGTDFTITDLPSMNGFYEVKDIIPGTLAAEGYQVLIIEKVWPGGTILSGTLNVTIDIEPYEVYEVSIPMNLFAAGKYYMTVDGTDQVFTPFNFQSEPLETAESWPETIQIDWKNFENDFNILYSTGIVHRIRVNGFLNWPMPGGSRVVMEDARRKKIKLRENVTRNPTLEVFELPSYRLELIALILAHDYVALDDVEYTTEEDFEPEYFQNDPLGNGKVAVSQGSFMADNSHDDGANDVDVTALVVNGQILTVTP